MSRSETAVQTAEIQAVHSMLLVLTYMDLDMVFTMETFAWACKGGMACLKLQSPHAYNNSTSNNSTSGALASTRMGALRLLASSIVHGKN